MVLNIRRYILIWIQDRQSVHVQKEVLHPVHLQARHYPLLPVHWIKSGKGLWVAKAIELCPQDRDHRMITHRHLAQVSHRLALLFSLPMLVYVVFP